MPIKFESYFFSLSRRLCIVLEKYTPEIQCPLFKYVIYKFMATKGKTWVGGGREIRGLGVRDIYTLLCLTEMGNKALL